MIDVTSFCFVNLYLDDKCNVVDRDETRRSSLVDTRVFKRETHPLCARVT